MRSRGRIVCSKECLIEVVPLPGSSFACYAGVGKSTNTKKIIPQLNFVMSPICPHWQHIKQQHPNLLSIFHHPLCFCSLVVAYLMSSIQILLESSDVSLKARWSQDRLLCSAPSSAQIISILEILSMYFSITQSVIFITRIDSTQHPYHGSPWHHYTPTNNNNGTHIWWILEWSRVRMLKPVDILVSAATTQ